MRQRLSACRAGTGGAGTACTAFGAGVMPYAGSVLGGFGGRSSRCWGGRNRHCSGLIRSLLIVESLVVYIRSTTHRAVGLFCAPASRAVVRAHVVRYCSRSRGRRRVLVGRRERRSRRRQHVGGAVRLFQRVGRFFPNRFVLVAG